MKVSRMVAEDGLPFRVFCTSQDLRDLFSAAGYKLPTSPYSIKLMVMNYGMTLKLKIQRDLAELKDDNHRFTSTFDEWTSSKNRRYMNVNIHTCKKNKSVFWNLGLIRIYGSMPAETAVDLLKKRVSEFGLSLDDDVVNITTDGASVMTKVGRLISPLQQLCHAHGIQLSIIDCIYKKQDLPVSAEDEIDEIPNLLGEETETNSDDEDDVFYCYFPTHHEVDLDTRYASIIKKFRKLVKLFKNSPTKNDLLQVYINQEFDKNLQLHLDCKTRWSSLADMISTFNKVKLCVSKALIDLGLDTDSEYSLSAEECTVLTNLERIFEPVKLAVEVLCHRDSDLVTAETTLRFVIRELEEQSTPLAKKLAESLIIRISKRRTCLTSVLLYLRNFTQYKNDLEEYSHDQTFIISPKTTIRKEIKKLKERLHCKTQYNYNSQRRMSMLLHRLHKRTMKTSILKTLQCLFLPSPRKKISHFMKSCKNR